MLDYVKVGRKIKEARDHQGLTQDQLAAILNYKTGVTISGWENGNRKIGTDDLLKLANVLHQPLEYFIGEGPLETERIDPASMSQKSLGELLGVRYIPVVGKIAAGRPLFAMEDIETKIPIPVGTTPKPDFALRVGGDSMIDDGIKDGNLALIKRQDNIDFPGQIAAVVIGEETALRYVFPSEDGGCWLVAGNHACQPVKVSNIEDAHIIGVYAGGFQPAPASASFQFTPPTGSTRTSQDFGPASEDDERRAGQV
jgi:repressor LexA